MHNGEDENRRETNKILRSKVRLSFCYDYRLSFSFITGNRAICLLFRPRQERGVVRDQHAEQERERRLMARSAEADKTAQQDYERTRRYLLIRLS